MLVPETTMDTLITCQSIVLAHIGTGNSYLFGWAHLGQMALSQTLDTGDWQVQIDIVNVPIEKQILGVELQVRLVQVHQSSGHSSILAREELERFFL
jgi:hypothetical protein